MDSFEVELMRRSPLAAAVLEVCDFIFDDQLLDSIWQKHRGRCYDDVLRFDQFLRMMRDALLRHDGSAHQLFLKLQRRRTHIVDESNFYRKLSHIPVAISRALLSGCTARLRQLMPASGPARSGGSARSGGAAGRFPACFDGFELIAADGKKIKNAAKRLKPARGYSGSLLGAKALVALDLRCGMAIAMYDSLDGLSNDVPLVPGLIEQLHELFPAADHPILSVWDRQFDDPRTLKRLSARPRDAFVVRMKQAQMPFEVHSVVRTRDAQGRAKVVAS